MSITGLDIVSASLRKIGSLAAGDVPSATAAADALKILNVMIDAWGIQRSFMLSQLRTVTTLGASTSSYSLGSGGDIDIVRPQFIERAGLIIDTTADTPSETPIEVLTDQRWAAVRMKTLTSRLVQAIYYDRAWSAGLANIYVYPVPTVGTTQLVLYSAVATARFADTTTAYLLPPGYQEAFEFNLAVRLAGEWGKTVTAHVDEIARHSKYNIAIANLVPSELGCDPAMTVNDNRGGGTFNWMTNNR